MNIQDIISSVFQLVIIPVLIILTKYLVSWISTKAEELKTKTNNELYNKYIDMLNQTVTNCVMTTQQTYVDSLKKQGKFDLEAQKQAFQDTYAAVLKLLPQEAYEYLNTITADLDQYIVSMIETRVYYNHR